MKKDFKGNKILAYKDRFKIWEKEKRLWLKKLSLRKAIKLEESLLSSSLIWEWRKNFSKDEPLICFKDLLKKRAKTNGSTFIRKSKED